MRRSGGMTHWRSTVPRRPRCLPAPRSAYLERLDPTPCRTAAYTPRWRARRLGGPMDVRIDDRLAAVRLPGHDRGDRRLIAFNEERQLVASRDPSHGLRARRLFGGLTARVREMITWAGGQQTSHEARCRRAQPIREVGPDTAELVSPAITVGVDCGGIAALRRIGRSDRLARGSWPASHRNPRRTTALGRGEQTCIEPAYKRRGFEVCNAIRKTPLSCLDLGGRMLR